MARLQPDAAVSDHPIWPMCRDRVAGLADAGDLSAALDLLLEAATDVPGVNACALFVIQPDGALDLILQRGLSPACVDAVSHCSPESRRAVAARCGRPALLSAQSLAEEMGYVPPGADGICACISLPIVRAGRAVAALSLGSSTAGQFDDGIGWTLNDIASEVGAVLGRLHADGQTRARPSNLEQAMDAMDECLFVLDSEGTILHANDTTLRTVGRELSEIVNRSVLLLFPPQHAAEVTRLLEAILAGERPSCHVPLLARDGVETPVETRAVVGTWDGRLAIIGTARNLTEKQQMAGEIRRQHALLQMVLENARVAAYQRDFAGGADYVSPEADAVFGFATDPSPDITLARVLDRVHPDDAERLRTAVLGAPAEPGAMREVVFRCRADDGRYRWISDRYRVTLDADGVPARRAGTLQDVTAAQEAREAVAASEERYRSAITAMTEGLVVQDANGRITICNGRACEILGLTADQIMGRTPADPRWGAIREDGTPYRSEEHPSIVALRSGAACRGVTMGVRWPDGSVRWIETNAEPIRGSDDPTAAVVTTFTDVTDRRQREAELRDSADRFRSLFDSGLLAMCIVDPVSLRFVHVNRAFERLLGYDHVAILGGMDLNQITEEREATAAGVARCLSHGGIVIPKRWLRRRDGTVFPAQIVAGSYRWRGKKLVFGQLLDISDRILAEA